MKEESVQHPKPSSIRFDETSCAVRVICGVLFIIVTQIFLSCYIHQVIVSELQHDYVAKSSFSSHFVVEMESKQFREVIRKMFEVSNSRQKRNANYIGDNQVRAQNQDSQEELFDQKLGKNLEGKDQVVNRKKEKGAAPGGDSWIWVTSSSRIPEKALEDYCQKVQQFCPKLPGPQGHPGAKGDGGMRGFPGIPGDMGNRGFPGAKGEKGDGGAPGAFGFPGTHGMKGEPGLPGRPGAHGKKGEPGFSGIPGVPGAKGDAGRQGLDGRDGLPGEPGLYGTPGRNGYDGLPGKDGVPGIPGKNGTNGVKGDRGSPGPKGPPGQRGLTGPRGRSGDSGIPGRPGMPGVIAWKTSTVDKDNVTKYLIAPSIAGSQYGPMVPKAINEGENVTLTCPAVGTPSPRITWQRADNKPISRGAWQDIQVSTETLKLLRVNRNHTGAYMCIADNGVPPQVNQTYLVEVYFPPLVRISMPVLGVTVGSTAVLECETEGFPEPIRYWERDDGNMLENGTKYTTIILDKNTYTSLMQLSITNINAEDIVHKYYCISKNEFRQTAGEIQLFEHDPRMPTPRLRTTDNTKVYGPLPPDQKFSLEDICGPPLQCTECDAKDLVKCSSSGVSLIDLISRWEVGPLQENVTYAGYPNRTKDCVLYAVGKPVYHRSSESIYGCWMKDPNSKTKASEQKFWMTFGEQTDALYEFNNKTTFKWNRPDRKYVLKHPFGGNSHVVYDGNFFYKADNKNTIVRYNLSDESTDFLDLPISPSNNTRLYSGAHNVVDFSVDENGLWLIFAVPDSNNTAVMKVDTELMAPQYVWNVSLDHHKVGEMFIVCGVLYAVDSVTDRNSKIRFAFDLYKNVLLDVSLSFANPFRNTTMLAYNFRNPELYSWDKGNQLTYPVRYHDIGYNSTEKDNMPSPNR